MLMITVEAMANIKAISKLGKQKGFLNPVPLVDVASFVAEMRCFLVLMTACIGLMQPGLTRSISKSNDGFHSGIVQIKPGLLQQEVRSSLEL